MVATVGSAGAQVNLLIRQGGSFGPTLRLKNPDTTPINVTGATFEAHIRKRSTGPLIAAFTINVLDAPQGVIQLVLSAALTATLKAADDPAADSSKYIWDLEMTVGTWVTPLLYGDITVFREVTHA